MNNNIDLTKILKDCPEGEQFWSPMLGYVKLYNINQVRKIVSVILETYAEWAINADGTITICGITSPEIMLYPSKDQLDWSKFTAPWHKKEKFDINTLKPFDKVLVRNTISEYWECEFFSRHIDDMYPYVGIANSYKFCIPYNDDTKHLVGTTDEAPEYYRYWED